MRTSAFGLPATLTLPRRVRARHRALAPCRFRGFLVLAQETTSRAPAGSIESIAPHALQIPARRAESSLFLLFFNLIIFTQNQNRVRFGQIPTNS